ncbi:TYR3-like protein [Mya arenaria]|uniref:TYR3-like protein n=1 Tax=Mya arenaria TaxID=6604 RepID=A0ABY7ETI2_MYAAR|nr:TYR3-like protein [Mya arenaria]
MHEFCMISVNVYRFEEALRMHEPGVALPYWDSTLDDAMDNPVSSLLWTSKYMGNGDGDVVSGPAAGWVSAVGRLQRQFGRFSRLMKKPDIDQIMTKCLLKEIESPTANGTNNLEWRHGGPHVWVGGDMSGLDTAAYDPVFFMHHAFIDYIWEKFRRRQMTVCGKDPSTDYPTVSTYSDAHRPYDAMVGFKSWTNLDGIRSSWTDNWYSYADSPTCSDCCPGCGYPPPIVCDYVRNMCVAASRFNASHIIARGSDGLAQFETGAFSAELGLPLEKTAVLTRNRGRLFAAPPSDGRTVFTAATDILTARSGGTF